MRPSTLNSNLDDRNTPINGEGGYPIIHLGYTELFGHRMAVHQQAYSLPPAPAPTKSWSFSSWPPSNDMNRELVKRFNEIAPE